MVKSASVFAHQETSPTAGPTPNAPATGDIFHVPNTSAGKTLENLYCRKTPVPTSIFTSILFPSADNA